MPLTVKAYDPIIAILRTTLLANSELVSGPSWKSAGSPTIYPDYINAIDNPVYPALTISMGHSMAPANSSPVNRNRYYIHGWGKRGPDEVAYLYNLVLSTFEAPPADLLTCRKIDGRCPLYDKDTRTHYFMTEWLIYANQALIYA